MATCGMHRMIGTSELTETRPGRGGTWNFGTSARRGPDRNEAHNLPSQCIDMHIQTSGVGRCICKQTQVPGAATLRAARNNGIGRAGHTEPVTHAAAVIRAQSSSTRVRLV
eukprot:750151-Hanusia_phi.AAC.1